MVAAADYVVWRNALGQAVTYFSGADGSGNGVVDAGDYLVWQANFGAPAASRATLAQAVPEPSTFWLLVLAISAGIWRRTNRSSRAAE